MSQFKAIIVYTGMSKTVQFCGCVSIYLQLNLPGHKHVNVNWVECILLSIMLYVVYFTGMINKTLKQIKILIKSFNF